MSRIGKLITKAGRIIDKAEDLRDDYKGAAKAMKRLSKPAVRKRFRRQARLGQTRPLSPELAGAISTLLDLNEKRIKPLLKALK